MMLMIPPETLNSTRSPGLIPALRLRDSGTTIGVFFFTTVVMSSFYLNTES